MDGQPEPAVPLVLARRIGQAATFTALHEPYTGAPKLRRLERLAENENAVVMAAEMPEYTDYLCVAFDDQPRSAAAGLFRWIGSSIISKVPNHAVQLFAGSVGWITR